MKNVKRKIAKSTRKFIERIKEGNDVIIRFNFGLQTWQFVFWG